MTAADAPDIPIERLARLLDDGHAELAAREAAALRARFPHAVQVMRLHAIALLQLGRLEEARATLIEARALAPQSVDVLCNLASVLLAGGTSDQAIAVLDEAAALAPAHPAVLNGLGNARRAAGDLAGAREAYAQATRAMPDHLGAWINLAAAELECGDVPAAERSARHALARAPGHPQGLFVLGHALAAGHRYAQAEQAYATAARAAPGDARFPYHVGLMAEELQHFAAAAEAHALALSLDPGFDQALGQLVFLRRQLSDWRDLDALSARLRARVAARAPRIAPFAFLAEPAAGADEQLRCARTFARGIERDVAAARARHPFRHSPQPADSRLRLGFVANGFGNHPTNLLIVAFIEALRGEDVEVHLFSTAPDDTSAPLQRLRSAADVWHDASNSTASMLAHAIHAAKIDVALDVDGYCAGSMPAALALRPAPVQVNWLAYPGSLGAPWIDYVIADRIVLPAALHAQFSESVAWLPRCFQPSDPTRRIGTTPSRSECGLPRNGVVYACFNNRFKINRAGFARMLAVLRDVPESVLWLLAGPDGADARLRAEASRSGIGAERLVFAPKVAHAQYLARYAHADLFLDSEPYGAHTTASDAIWAGCPVLTVAGPVFAARVAASLNHHLGMPELTLPDWPALVRAAVQLGHDADARTALRARLAERRDQGELFDMRGYARDFVVLLRRMMERRGAGLAAARLD